MMLCDVRDQLLAAIFMIALANIAVGLIMGAVEVTAVGAVAGCYGAYALLIMRRR